MCRYSCDSHARHPKGLPATVAGRPFCGRPGLAPPARQCFLSGSGFAVGLAFTGGDQAAQTAGEVIAPRVGTGVVALVLGGQTHVREPDLGLTVLLRDAETDRGAVTLGLVL